MSGKRRLRPLRLSTSDASIPSLCANGRMRSMTLRGVSDTPARSNGKKRQNSPKTDRRGRRNCDVSGQGLLGEPNAQNIGHLMESNDRKKRARTEMGCFSSTRKLSVNQAVYNRLLRNGLLDPFSCPVEAARVLIGSQAQACSYGYLALWLRAKDSASVNKGDDTRPNGRISDLRQMEDLLHVQRKLARITAYRGTVHCLATEDLPLATAAVGDLVIEAVEKRTSGGLPRSITDWSKGNGVKDLASLSTARKFVVKALKSNKYATDPVYPGVPIVARSILQGLGIDKRVGYGMTTCLTAGGTAVRVEKGDYKVPKLAHRSHWISPDEVKHQEKLWMRGGQGAKNHRALVEMARRYFAAFGPALETDFRNYLGCKAGPSKAAVNELLKDQCLTEVDIESPRRDSPLKGKYLVMKDHIEELESSTPDAKLLPVIVLGMFDPLVLGYKDKTLMIDEAYKRRIWRNTDIFAVFLVEGKIRGVWNYDRVGVNTVVVRIEIFESNLNPKQYLEVTGRIREIMSFFGFEVGDFEKELILAGSI